MERGTLVTVGRPELVGTLAASGGSSLPYSDAEARTRYMMEALILPRVKGRKSPDRASYGPRDGAAALLGLASRSASGAPDAYTQLSVLEAVEAGGGVTHDPVGRLVPPLKVPTFDENEFSYINLIALSTEILSRISRLSVQDAAALQQAPEARSACLELNVDASTASFRWNADGKDYWVVFKYPDGGTPPGELFNDGPPAYQAITRLHFPLLFAVGRLFAAAPKHRSVDPDPSSGNAPASAEPEKGNAAPARAASLGNRSRNSRTRQSAPGKVGGEREVLKPLLLSRDRLPSATLEQDIPAPWPRPMT